MRSISNANGDWEIHKSGRKWYLYRWLPDDGEWCCFGPYKTLKSALEVAELDYE